MILSVYLRHFLILQSQKGDKNIQLHSNNLIRADHPSNTKWGGVYIFYKETLAICIVKSLNFNERIVCEVSMQNSKGYIGIIYRSLSQDIIEFENFILKFGKSIKLRQGYTVKLFFRVFHEMHFQGHFMKL